MSNSNIQIRNSTVDFLVFTRDAGEDGIEVRVQDHDVWLTQKGISKLFDIDRSVVAKHLKNIFGDGELDENSVCAKFAQTVDDGKTYQYKFFIVGNYCCWLSYEFNTCYSIPSVGYKGSGYLYKAGVCFG
jgi:hypothetical protein